MPPALVPPGTATPVATAVPAVFISHGKNGYGAWQPNGTRVSSTPSGDEASNVNGTTTATPAVTNGYLSNAFFSRTPSSSSSLCSDPAPGGGGSASLCEFDDIVMMITSNVLIARMVSAGRLP